VQPGACTCRPKISRLSRWLRNFKTARILLTGIPEDRMDTSTVPDCKHEAGRFVPVIDRSRCEGKEDCVQVCPYSVFEMRQLSDSDKRALRPGARLKAWVHGNRQAFAVNAQNCHACGLCVSACPERAIKLSRLS
jgi:4Fe-4S ferredoxin